ncbi:c-type cytochrome biogenesis protein CcsB [Rhodococcus maanshanensis]|uniref:Cytochrome c-type biogenesis protein CcsB n=1 Tax=Rhodococcus maanshanensis TaxID=183556 RepID=A0A1H7V3D5_9NOCA|nr:c-type cytochrome biogenesis protein CcsB [Rhodococcus maanshanensis]SEM03742.1 cytochrome c-type biogenesis protein CcsB [Rhodococcus maanshanensis]
MPVNTTLAQYSDYAFASAFAIYVLALVLSAFDFAGTSVRRRVAADAQTRAVTAVGAPTPDTPGRISAADSIRPPSERAGRAAIAVTLVALTLNVAAIVLRGMATGRWPLGNLYEYALFLCAAITACWLVAVRQYPIRNLTVFVLAPVVILLFIAAAAMYNEAAPVVPALRSYWIAIHVTIIVSACGILTFASTASLLHVIAVYGRDGARGSLAWIANRLPSAELLDRVAYRTTLVGFPLYTIGVMCGAIWAEAAWGRFWGWDPKETVSFIAWVLYAAYLHARATSGWGSLRASWINVAALATTLFNMFAINFVVSGLHSYAGLN